MYEELKGKKLLIIGADVNDMEIVRTAQAKGSIRSLSIGQPTIRKVPPNGWLTRRGI